MNIEEQELSFSMIPLDVSLAPHSASNYYSGLENDCPLGLFVATQRRLRVGTSVLVRVRLPSGAGFEMTGRVAWVRARCGLGIAFDHLDRQAIRAVSRFTREREPLFYA